MLPPNTFGSSTIEMALAPGQGVTGSQTLVAPRLDCFVSTNAPVPLGQRPKVVAAGVGPQEYPPCRGVPAGRKGRAESVSPRAKAPAPVLTSATKYCPAASVVA